MIGKEVLNYRIEEKLGEGGMGSVYLAVNKNINQKVAVKVLNANLADSVVIRQRFRDEAQLLCSLDHSNIVKFLNFVENDEGIFLIMEYIDGITLEDFIDTKNGLLVEKRAYEMFDQILDAFAYAHKRGVVHRDIKPANIILSGDPDGNFVPKVLDFGIAKIVSESNKDDGWVVGTPSYMSPEQVLGKEVDARSDIYSLGVLLHQMLTGRVPYDTTTLPETAIGNKIVKDPLPRMKEFYPYISSRMQKLVDKATAKAPGDRFQSCNAFRKVMNPNRIPKAAKFAAAAAALLIIAGGLFFWDYNRVKTRYFKDYVEQWGIPQGIHRISGAEFRHRQMTYRMVYTQRKLRSLALVNSNGNVIEDDRESERFDRPINAKFSYRANGNIDYVLYMDRNDKVLFRKVYEEGMDGRINLVIFKYADDFGAEKRLPKNMTGYVRLENEEAERGQVSRFALTFDDRGFISTLHYRNAEQAVGDGERIYGKRYERDAKGRVIKEYFLSHDDSVRATSWGLGVKQFTYDAEDNWVEAVYLGPDGSPALDDKDGIPIYAMEYDKYGNLTYAWHKSSDGNLVLPKKTDGLAGRKITYNDAGQMIEWFNLGTDKNPVYSIVYGNIGIQYEYDPNGYVSKETYVDENGQPTVCSGGYTIMVCEKDAKGNALVTQYFDIDNQPYETSSGYTKVVNEYDSSGNNISVFYYDKTDSLCLSRAGIAGQRWEYNKQNRVVKTSYFGTDNQPTEDTNGILSWGWDYDSKGNVIQVRYYEADGKTLKLHNTAEIAGWKSEYDDNSNETKREFFDAAGEPTAGTFGFVKWEAAYDDLSNQTEIVYFDVNGALLYGYQNTYDDRGNLVESFRCGQDRKLASGYLIARYKYDDRDNRIEFARYDGYNNPGINSDGYSKTTSVYDDRNQEIERRYYDARGNLCFVQSEGYAVTKREYDNRGNAVKVSFFDASEKPLKVADGRIAARINEFDAMGNFTRTVWLDETMNPTNPAYQIPERLYKYDKWGNRIYYALADGSGKLIVSANGWAVERSEYDIRGRRISRAVYDEADKPSLDRQNNAHKTEWIYDKQGNAVEARYYDASVSLRKNGYAIEKYKYDEQGRLIEYALYDYLDRAVNGDGGWHRYVRSYQESGAMYDIHYTANNTIVEEWSYNPETDEWTRTDGWRQFWQNTMRSLPFNLYNGVQVISITLSGSTCTETMRFLGVSKYDLSGADMKTYEKWGKDQATLWKERSKMPRNATLIIIGVDNDRREIFRASF
jgi:serine/threonine-protein kinase